MHPTTLSRIETGRRGILPRDLKPILAVYGVTGERQEDLLTLARQARQRGWWQSYGDVLPSEYSTLIGLEAEASEIRIYEHQLIPGLLQTEDYARAIIRAFRPSDPDEEIDRRVKVRMERQSRLSSDPGLSLWVVLDEAVLRRTVSGPEVMRRQLQRLIELADRPGITLQVLPFSAGEHPGMTSPFVILRFPEPSDPDVVYVENFTSVWRKSSRSGGNGNCVELTSIVGRRVAVRDSKNPSSLSLLFDAAAWTTFTAGVRQGRYGSQHT